MTSAVSPLSREEIVAYVNRFADHGGARIRWSEEVQGFVTYEGDRYPDESIEDVARGLQRHDAKKREEWEENVAWLEVHQSVRDHRKIVALADALGVEENYALGLCVHFWLWAVDNAPTGHLPESNRAIARGCRWAGDFDHLLDCLIAAGLVDDRGDSRSIHDWADYAGKLIERRHANAQRMRESRAMHVQDTCDERARSHDTHVLGDSTVQNSTQPNSTKITPLYPPEGDPAAKPKRAKARTAISTEWELDERDVAYAEENGLRYEKLKFEEQRFYDHHKAKGTVSADWNASWRTWVNNWVAGYGRPMRAAK
jgi:hypothetical protein